MSTSFAAKPTVPNSWLRRTLILLSLAGACYALLTVAAFTPVDMDMVLVGRSRIALGACTADRFCTVERVRPGSAAAAGVRVGDRLRFDRRFDRLREENSLFLAGERIGATLRGQGGDRHIDLEMQPAQWTRGNRAQQASNNILSAITAVTTLAGLFLVIRAGTRNSVLLLGASLVFASMPVTGIPFWWWRDPLVYEALNALQDAAGAAGAVMFLGFARAFRRETAGGGAIVDKWVFRALAAGSAVWMIASEPFVLAGVMVPLGAADTASLTPASWISTALANLCYLGAIVVLTIGRSEAPASEKRRYTYIIPAVFLIVFVIIFNNFAYLTGGWDPTRNPIVFAMDVLPVVGLMLLAYGVLRHRVIDIGFVVNRTVVYGAVSAILLAAFGLIEWGFDHFVKIEGREQNALIDAAIALMVYLGFHRVTGFVERAVEALFFRRWQEKEAQLRRFVADAAFIGRREILLDRFAETLGGFADGVGAAIYLRAQGGGYARVAESGSVAPPLIDGDDPALVRLRADRKPVTPAEAGSALPAELTCPMLHRGELTGLVLMAGRAEGVGYRPDEAELLSWATLQVGLDLHALEVEHLQASVARLETRLESANLKAQRA